MWNRVYRVYSDLLKKGGEGRENNGIREGRRSISEMETFEPRGMLIPADGPRLFRDTFLRIRRSFERESTLGY